MFDFSKRSKKEPPKELLPLKGIMIFDFDQFLLKFHSYDNSRAKTKGVVSIKEIGMALNTGNRGGKTKAEFANEKISKLIESAAEDIKEMKEFFKTAMENGWAICIASFNGGPVDLNDALSKERGKYRYADFNGDKFVRAIFDKAFEGDPDKEKLDKYFFSRANMTDLGKRQKKAMKSANKDARGDQAVLLTKEVKKQIGSRFEKPEEGFDNIPIIAGDDSFSGIEGIFEEPRLASHPKVGIHVKHQEGETPHSLADHIQQFESFVTDGLPEDALGHYYECTNVAQPKEGQPKAERITMSGVGTTAKVAPLHHFTLHKKRDKPPAVKATEPRHQAASAKDREEARRGEMTDVDPNKQKKNR